MRLRNLFSVILIALSIGVPAVADSKVVGHMTPLPAERLDNPITLPDCPGLVIQEWRGSTPTPIERIRLNALCKLAMENFEPFLQKHNLNKRHNRSFAWGGSIIPDGKCYRCMNDTKYRFAQRSLKQELYGYTGKWERWLFTVNNTNSNYYRTIFTHELWHALSMHYGVYDNHHPTSNHQRTMIDEEYAKAFTEFLGFAR